MRFRMIATAVCLAAALALSATASAGAADFTGAGAIFPDPIFAKWADTYEAETGATELLGNGDVEEAGCLQLLEVLGEEAVLTVVDRCALVDGGEQVRREKAIDGLGG